MWSSDLRHADVLAGKDLTEIDLPPLEADPAARGDHGRPVVKRIVELLEAAIGPRRGRVAARPAPSCRAPGAAARGCSGATKASKRACCCSTLAAAGFVASRLQREVHALVPAVLLGMARRDPFDARCRGAATTRPACSGRRAHAPRRTGTPLSVRIACGQAKVLEGALEDGEGVALLRRRERLTREQIAAGEVGDRQRIAVAPIAEQELAFVVGAPERIRRRSAARARCPSAPVPAPAPPRHQAVAVEHRMHRADRRAAATPGQLLPQPLADLRRAPARDTPASAGRSPSRPPPAADSRADTAAGCGRSGPATPQSL